MLSPRGPQPGTPWGGCLAGIALLITVTGCQQRDATAAKQPPAPPPPAVIVAEIQQRSVQVSAEFVAQTQGVPTVEIRARVQGVLEQVRFKEGSEVQRGQVLFVIQQDEYKAALQSARAQLAKAQVEAGKAAVIQADLNLRYTTVQSPISGIISKVAIDTGNLVGKGEPTLLATVSSIHPIFVDFAISEADLLRLVKRVPGLGRGEVPPDRAATLELILADGSVFPHKGRAIFIDRAIDLKTGTIQVRAEFPNPDRMLRPGQFGRVRVVTEEVPDAILVPQIAVQELQGAKTVLVVEEGDKVSLRTVTPRE